MQTSSPVSSITKRDGSVVDFQPVRITDALLKAGAATGEFDSTVTSHLTENTIEAIYAISRKRSTMLRISTGASSVKLPVKHKLMADNLMAFKLTATSKENRS